MRVFNIPEENWKERALCENVNVFVYQGKKKTFVFKLREESFLRFFKAVLKLGSLS